MTLLCSNSSNASSFRVKVSVFIMAYFLAVFLISFFTILPAHSVVVSYSLFSVLSALQACSHLSPLHFLFSETFPPRCFHIPSLTTSGLCSVVSLSVRTRISISQKIFSKKSRVRAHTCHHSALIFL